MAELKGKIVQKNKAEQKVFGPVLIPNEPDSDGDVVSIEKIQQVHDIFNEKYENIDVQHSLQNVGKVYTSYVLEQETTFDFGTKYTYPKGTWMLGVKVTDETCWKLVENGVLTGFSIMAINPALKETALKNEDGRVTLADLGDDWVVNAVSLVDEPAVPKAKWIAIKSAEESIIDKMTKGLQGLLNMLVSKEDQQVLNEEVNDLTPEQIQQMINETIAPFVEALNELAEKEAKLEEKVAEIAGENKPEEEKPEDTEEKPEEDKEEAVKEEDAVEEEEETVEKSEAVAESDTEVSSVKAELEAALARVAELEKAQKSAQSKRLVLGNIPTEQEKQEVSKSLFPRDEFGRRIF